MNNEFVSPNGLGLLGCGKMGSALLEGWLAQGISPSSVWVLDPAPSEWVQSTGVNINQGMPSDIEIALIAVKPQMMGDALPVLQPLGNGTTLFVSIAAGTPISAFEAALGAETPIIRAMPNTPAAVARGISAIIGNRFASTDHLNLTESLLSAVGEVVRLEDEAQMDAVTAVSGSGPAYVFHLIETLASAAEKQGLPKDLSMKLARATVAGAGHYAATSGEDPGQLRENVTSPAGTTAAALEVLMDKHSGFPSLLEKAVHAAALRSKELSK